ncbi:MAG: hypothetical protein K2P81_10025 [Bacteriovoracaceae bacterium]|nr:hypothetical protein [Bacteriovoracaceae bacterium]
MLVFVFLSLVFALSPEDIHCKPPMSKVDFVLPSTGERTVFCQEKVNGEYLDRGEKFIFSAEGKLLKGNPESVKLVGVDEKANDAQASNAIQGILSIFNPGANKLRNQEFKVNKCDTKRDRWIALAIFKQSFTANYVFGDSCDVQGTFSPKMGEKFPVQLKLRRLWDYQTVNFEMEINVKPDGRGVKYILNATQGLLQSGKEKIAFHGTYEMVLHLDAKKGKSDNEGGSITIESINGKEINKTSPIYVD